MKLQFVIHTGDITQNGMSDTVSVFNAIDAMNKLEAPLFYIPGNHDIFQEHVEEEINIFQEYFGDLIFVKEFEEVSFIGLYSDPLAYSFSVENYDPFLELEKALKTTNGKPVIVFHHIPSVESFYNNTMHDGWENENRDRWEKTLNSYNVIAILAGHFHSDELHWIGEIPLYVSASVTNRFGRQPSFRIYEYKNGKLSYRTQYETK
jgi:3',5'-cyclic AMP phosphodiesterase CpdA